MRFTFRLGHVGILVAITGVMGILGIRAQSNLELPEFVEYGSLNHQKVNAYVPLVKKGVNIVSYRPQGLDHEAVRAYVREWVTLHREGKLKDIRRVHFDDSARSGVREEIVRSKFDAYGALREVRHEEVARGNLRQAALDDLLCLELIQVMRGEDTTSLSATLHAEDSLTKGLRVTWNAMTLEERDKVVQKLDTDRAMAEILATFQYEMDLLERKQREPAIAARYKKIEGDFLALLRHEARSRQMRDFVRKSDIELLPTLGLTRDLWCKVEERDQHLKAVAGPGEVAMVSKPISRAGG